MLIQLIYHYHRRIFVITSTMKEIEAERIGFLGY